MTERRRKMTGRFLRWRSEAVVCRHRISDDGAPPKDDGAVSQMMERSRHL